MLGLGDGRVVLSEELLIQALFSELHVIGCWRFLKLIPNRVWEGMFLSATSVSCSATFGVIQMRVPELSLTFRILPSGSHDSLIGNDPLLFHGGIQLCRATF